MKNKIIIATNVVILILWTIVLTSCISVPISTPTTFPSVPRELTDQSILTNQPCAAPCWHNLVPDQSSTQDAVELLTHTQFIDPDNILNQSALWWADTKDGEPIPAIRIVGFCIQPAERICAEIIVVKDTIKEITLYPNYKLTLEEIVGNWGDPDYMFSTPYGAECAGCIVSLFWSQFSAKVTSVDRRCAEGGDICKHIYDGGKVPYGFVVEEIVYSGSLPPYAEDWNKEYRMPWVGFKNP